MNERTDLSPRGGHNTAVNINDTSRKPHLNAVATPPTIQIVTQTTYHPTPLELVIRGKCVFVKKLMLTINIINSVVCIDV
jgi:hypothetical protein